MPGDVVVVALRDDSACWLHPSGENGFAAPRGPVPEKGWGPAAAAVVASISSSHAIDVVHHCYVPQVIGEAPVFGIVTARIRGTAAPADTRLVPVALDGLRGVADELAADAPTVIALQAIALDGLPKTPRRELSAFLSEREDPVRALYTAEFDCELSAAESLTLGPQRASLPEALAWARAAAPRVDLEIGGKRYSAGRHRSHEGYELWAGQIDVVPRPTGREPIA